MFISIFQNFQRLANRMALLCGKFRPRILKIVFQGVTPASFQNHTRFIAFTKSASCSVISFLFSITCWPFPTMSVFKLSHVAQQLVFYLVIFEVKQLWSYLQYHCWKVTGAFHQIFSFVLVNLLCSDVCSVHDLAWVCFCHIPFCLCKHVNFCCMFSSHVYLAKSRFSLISF